MFKKIKDIFFDLDHTIWDFDKNAQETLHELYYIYKFDKLFNQKSSDPFIATYTHHNHRLWGLYHHGKIDKATLRKARFEDTFKDLGVAPDLFPTRFEEDYLRICPTKTNLFPHAHETLAYLQKRYSLHLITNGFKEASVVKIEKSKLKDYFKTIVISELVGVNKPHPQIFEHAVHNAETHSNYSVMVGDNIDADVRGAQNFGMSAIFFNPNHVEKPLDVNHQISCLKELTTIL